MAKRIKPRNRLKIVGNSAAMADLAMLLLIFFMVTTNIVPNKSIEVDLPKGKTEGADSEIIYITLTKDSTLFFENQNLTLDQLEIRLSARANEKDKKVAISADATLNYQLIAGVLQILRKLEFLNVVFLTDTDKGDYKTPPPPKTNEAKSAPKNSRNSGSKAE
jgi:biopolymer transport protein ExbD